jgi:hypothetical protein
MADASILAQTHTNAGVATAYATTNFEQIVNTQGLSGRILECSIVKDGGSDMTEAEFVTVLKALGNAGGDRSGTDTNGPDAFTVVGISDFDGTDPVQVLLQGTGTVNTTPVAGFTLTVSATYALAV